MVVKKKGEDKLCVFCRGRESRSYFFFLSFLLLLPKSNNFIHLLIIYLLQLTGVRLNNVTNDFIMLANAQFVENVSYAKHVFLLLVYSKCLIMLGSGCHDVNVLWKPTITSRLCLVMLRSCTLIQTP